MALTDEISKLENSSTKIRFAELLKICRERFGGERVKGSHHIFKTPWPGDPRINLQKDGNKAKPYQVDQVVAALRRLAEIDEDEK
ncbi:MAG: toxin HicA [Acidobacteriota bacterium]|nr:MAG: toxin HicA [Acidobacteriota bacterium]